MLTDLAPVGSIHGGTLIAIAISLGAIALVLGTIAFFLQRWRR